MIRRFRPKSLASQLTLLLLGAVLLAQGITTAIFTESRRASLEAAGREQVLGRTAVLARLIETAPVSEQHRILIASSSPRLRYSISATPLVSTDEVINDPELKSRIADLFGPDRVVRGRLSTSDDGDDGDDPPALRPPGPPDPGGPIAGRLHRRDDDRPALLFSVALSDGRWLNGQTFLPRPIIWAWPTIVSTLVMALAILAAVALSMRRITRPLRELARAADRLGRGETVAPLATGGPEEIAAAAQAFNAMQARVRRFVDDRTRMVAAISHDLRTPLTAMRLRAEFVDDDEVRDRMVDSIDEMVRMTEATLAFARDEAITEETRHTDLSALVEAVSDDFTDMGADVAVTAPDRLDHMVRQVALRRALRNLVENAVRYGERARVVLEEDRREIRIRVDDDGPGIPADSLEDVFAPFTRLETSRNAETGGVGLGLATARSIVRAHGGELTLANRPDGGLSATIHLPRPADEIRRA